MENGEDPFASIIRLCRPTASQEAKLRHKCFPPEDYPDPYLNQLSSSPEPTPSEPAGIFMVSPPASAEEEEEEEDVVFHTPPEHHHLSTSEDELLCAKGARTYDVKDGRCGSKRVRVRVSVSAGESDDEADSKKIRVSSEEFAGGTEEVVIETQANKAVVQIAAAAVEVIVVEDSDDSCEKMDKFNLLNKDSTNLGQKNGVLMKDYGGIVSVNGCSEMRQEEKSVNKVRKSPTKDDDGKRIGEIDDVGKSRKCSRDSGGSSQLPPSFDGKGKNIADETMEDSKEGGLLDFLHILKLSVGDNMEDEDVDILEAAKRRGLTFPPPRWWGDDQ